MAKANPVGKNLVIIVVVLTVILLVLKVTRGSKVDVDATLDAESGTALTEDETLDGVTVDVGAEGDTYVDTLSTMVARLEQQEQASEAQKAEKDRLNKRNAELQKSINQANKQNEQTESRLETLVGEIRGLKDNLTNLEKRTNKSPSRSDFASTGEYPINNKLPTLGTPNLSSPKLNVPSRNETTNINYDDEVVWVAPIDSQTVEGDDGAFSLKIPEIRIGDTLRGTELYKEVADTGYGRSVGMEQGDVKGHPYITIPRGSTGIDSVALTALVGRIPLGGAVVDPYRFKAIISAENLASNGITIDGLAGAVVGGQVTGDYALKCVTGKIDYITFTFNDGSISTFPEPNENGQSSSSSSLGYISDNSGVPCISGTFISNGSEYIAQLAGLSALNAGANAYAQNGTVTTTSPEGSTNAIVDADEYALGEAFSAGIETGTDWLSQRQQSAFDAVYVPPASRLTIHFESEISLNYNPNGRRTNHADYMQANSAVGYDYTGLN